MTEIDIRIYTLPVNSFTIHIDKDFSFRRSIKNKERKTYKSKRYDRYEMKLLFILSIIYPF